MRLICSSAFAVFALLGCGAPEVCGEVSPGAPVALTPHPVAGLHAYAHAHNDYEHERPLLDAIDHRFYSVEADVFFSDGRFEVSHGGFSGSKGTLQALYLDPLQQRVDALGSVHGDGVRFTLWIDLKDGPKELPAALEALLAQYPMLSSTDADGTGHEGEVRVILTGDRGAKSAFDSILPRHAVRDSNDFSSDDPPESGAWRAYALDWNKYVGWNGTGALSGEPRERLACITAQARADGREVRFYNAPDREELWRTYLEFGVSFLHTDKLAELEALLAE